MVNEKALLILDLDETLIHSSTNELGRNCDFRAFDLFVYKRPHLDIFFTEIFKLYKVAIWSTGSDDYVEFISNKILPEGYGYEFIWGRSRCTARKTGESDFYPGHTEYIKPIKKLRKKGYKRERILIVDDTQFKLSDNYGNAIYISEFTGNGNDDELKRLSDYLMRIADVPNFRIFEKRGWRENF